MALKERHQRQRHYYSQRNTDSESSFMQLPKGHKSLIVNG